MSRRKTTRKRPLTARLADAVHGIETVPLPGTRFYSFLVARQMRPLYEAIARQMSDAGRFQRVLDVGSGPGYVAIEMALRNPNVSVVGIDPSRYMVDIARTNASVAKVSKSVQFETSDPLNLPFPGRYFDLAVSVNVMHHWRDPLQVFESVYHVLATDGEFWVYDYGGDVGDEVWAEIRKGMSFLMRSALQFGPMSSARSAYGRQQLLHIARETHFECLGVEDVTLPLFGRDAPVFNRLRLHKR